jgi:hypothetical protein
MCVKRGDGTKREREREGRRTGSEEEEEVNLVGMCVCESNKYENNEKEGKKDGSERCEMTAKTTSENDKLKAKSNF